MSFATGAGLTVTCVVPARLDSNRLPAKLLRPIQGIPLLVHTLDRAVEANCFVRVICLTDHPRLAEIVTSAGHEACLSGNAVNGTDRIAKHLHLLPGDLFVNLQGDEPAFPASGLRQLAEGLTRVPRGAHLLLHRQPAPTEALVDPHRVKAEVDANGRIVDLWRVQPLWRGLSSHLQAGAYGYARPWLQRYAALPPSARELALSHEMLRLPDLDELRAHAFVGQTQSVDVEADLVSASRLVATFPTARRA